MVVRSLPENASPEPWREKAGAGWRRVRALLVLTLLLPGAAVALPPLVNQLKGDASAYLGLHGNDPVAWQTWDGAVLQRAREENKLLFISLGYFSCHWCHVMQRESFSDAAVAAILNKHFIPVKVDRELFPALDAYLIDFVRRTRGQAGWPLNVFVTPDGYPLVGMVYLQRTPLEELLQNLKRSWSENPAKMRKMAAAAATPQLGPPPLAAEKLNRNDLTRIEAQFTEQAMAQADEVLGGFGEQSKFPATPQLQALMLTGMQTGMQSHQPPRAKPVADFLLLTLEQMATQGLRDHIGGGFFRYTVDPDWQTPHFEKMLYDNANLALLYLQAASVFQRKDFEAIAFETLNFMIREFQAESGAMMSSLSAVDAQGVEGGYYLWSSKQLADILTAEQLDTLRLLWRMNDTKPLDAGFLPRQAQNPDDVAKTLGLTPTLVLQRMGAAYSTLAVARKARRLPVDTKQLSAWNGLALSALVAGAKRSTHPRYRDAADKIRHYLVTELYQDGRLWRAKGKQGALGQAGLEDYVFVAQGLWDWANLSQTEADKKIAKELATVAWKQFYTPNGWRLTDESLLPPATAERMLTDNPLPSASAALINLSLHIAADKGSQTHAVQWRELASTALAISKSLLLEQAYRYPGQVMAIRNLLE